MRKRILIVDDEPFARYPIAHLLKATGYIVIEAGDGKEALALILGTLEREKPFDLLLTDIQMPEMSGIELINELESQGISLPIFVISGTGDETLVNKLLNNGCLDYSRKPYKLEEFVSRVGEILEKAETKEDGTRQAASLS